MRKDGSTARETLLSVQRQTGRTPPLLKEEPLLNKYQQWLMDVFFELSETRDYTLGGPSAIKYQEIHAFVNATHTTLTAWEVETIRRMDRAYLSQIQIQTKEDTE